MRELLVAVLLVLGHGGASAAPPPPASEPAAAQDEAATEDPQEGTADTEAAAGTAAGTAVTPTVEPAREEPTPSGYQEIQGHAESAMDGDLRVSVMAGAELRPARGYLPVQITLQNTGSVPREVRLSAEASGVGRGGGSTERQVEVGAHQRLVTWLPIPVLAGAGVVKVFSPGLSLRSFPIYTVEPMGQPVLVLGSEKVFQAGSQMARVDQRPELSVRFIPLEDAPRELAAYVGASPVVVAGDVTVLSAEAWSALEAYTATGGLLLLLKPPRDVARRLPLLVAGAPAESPKGWYDYGFGKVILCETPGCGDAFRTLDYARTLVDQHRVPPGILKPAGASPRWQGRGQLNEGAQPLLSGVRAPVGRFMLLITLFVLAVGPGGLLLARRRGPVALLVAVPSVALVTCLGIVIWSVLVEGFSVHAARYSLIWLDRERDRAVVAGVGGYYANLEPRGFQVPALAALLSPDLEWDAQALDADWTQGMRVTGGFLPSRTYREWGEVAVAPSRARLVVKREGKGWRVQNALGANLEMGCVRLGETLWSLPALAQGAEGDLQPAAKDQSEGLVLPVVSDGRGRFTDAAWSSLLSRLPEGGFLARLDGAGMGPTTALEVELAHGEHYMRGRVDGP